MAIYGLQVDFANRLLSEYFGLNKPNTKEKIIFVGLGMTQEAAHANTEDFTEVNGGKPLGNYNRARVVFGNVENNVIYNINEIIFNTASEDWTPKGKAIEMIGLFDTYLYDTEDETVDVKPLVVLRLPESLTINKGETVILEPGSIQLSLTDI